MRKLLLLLCAAPLGAALPATDTFTAANGTALNTHNASWTYNSGGFVIQSNALAGGALSTVNIGFWNADTFNANQYAQGKVGGFSGSTGCLGVAVRAVVAPVHGYTLQYCTNAALYLKKDGTGTALATYGGLTLVAGDVIRLEVNGTTLTSKLNGTTLGSVTDSTYSTGSAGISAWTNDTAELLDDWEGGNLSASPTFTMTPTAIPNGHSGNITLTLSGTSTSWTGSTVFTPSGVANVSKISQNVTNGTTATVVVTTGAGTGTLTLTESVTGTATATTAVSVPSLGISPTSWATGGTPSLTLTGTNTVWSQETAAGLFTVSGGTGASLNTATITSNTAGTITLTVGSATGTLTITDASTGKTATFTATGAVTMTAVPTAVPISNTGLFVRLTGTGTSWSGHTFTVSGVSGTSVTAQSIVDTTHVTLTITTASTAGTLTISDGTISTTIVVGMSGGLCAVVGIQ